MKGDGDYDKIRQQWDLWGPLIISLITASMGAFGTSGSVDEAFTSLFIGMWLGPLVITLNANLLGANAYLLIKIVPSCKLSALLSTALRQSCSSQSPSPS
jgi:hypothetical protein